MLDNYSVTLTHITQSIPLCLPNSSKVFSLLAIIPVYVCYKKAMLLHMCVSRIRLCYCVCVLQEGYAEVWLEAYSFTPD